MKKLSTGILIILSFILLYGCQDSNIDSNMSYYGIKSEAALRELLDESNLFYNGYSEAKEDAVGSGDEKNTSTTNVRTDGLDEGDVVKVDDKYIYYIKQQNLYIIDHQTNSVVLNETLETENTYSYFYELYIVNNYLVVIGQSYGHFDLFYETDKAEGMIDFYWFITEKTMVLVYDIDTLLLEKTYELPGYLSATRLKDDQIYLITNQYIYNHEDIDPRPVFIIDDEEILPDYEEIKTHDAIDKHAYTIFTTLSFEETTTLTYDILLGPGYFYTTYFSNELLFLSTYQYRYDELEGYQSNGLFLAYDYLNGFEFVGYGNFDGYIINDYAIDYEDNHLRLVTTDGFGETVINRLYIFKENEGIYQMVSLLDEGIGKPRETVRSVLFNGDEVTIVTFEQIDPFYVIDISNVNQPVITQSLEISGFSLYQHTWAQDIVLGIGFEVEDNRTTGIKLAMYDKTTDLNVIGNPLVLSNEENSYQFSEALYNRKAMLFDIERNFFGFTVYKSFWDENTYSQVVEYLIFDVDLESNTPISVKKAISHDFVTDSNYYYNNIDRAVYVDNHLFVMSGLGVTVHDINQDFIEIDRIVFN